MRAQVHISLMANPSHLEAVNPLVSGKTRALSRQVQETPRETPAEAFLTAFTGGTAFFIIKKHTHARF